MIAVRVRAGKSAAMLGLRNDKYVGRRGRPIAEARMSVSRRNLVSAAIAVPAVIAIAAAAADDQKVPDRYGRHGVQVVDLDAAAIEKWRALGRATAWERYAEKTALSAELIRLAEAVAPLRAAGLCCGAARPPAGSVAPAYTMS
jgi:hypothetical protein